MSGLPNGAVTTLFTDIIGSTHLAGRGCVHCATILAELRGTLRAAAGWDVGYAMRILHLPTR